MLGLTTFKMQGFSCKKPVLQFFLSAWRMNFLAHYKLFFVMNGGGRGGGFGLLSIGPSSWNSRGAGWVWFGGCRQSHGLAAQVWPATGGCRHSPLAASIIYGSMNLHFYVFALLFFVCS
jgi:hypothetical protein